ncbi:unnamed protein product, partial [Rotaria sp. Silwood2]
QKRRLTIWYEVCTTEQLKNIRTDKKHELMANGTVTLASLSRSAPITVLPGETTLRFVKRVETAHGLSMSKVGPPRYILEKHDISFSTNGSKTE